MRRIAWDVSRRAICSTENRFVFRATFSSSTGLCQQAGRTEVSKVKERNSSSSPRSNPQQLSNPAQGGVDAWASGGASSVFQTQAEVQGRTLTFETGRLAVQAAGACTASEGNTQVLGTVSFQHDDGLRFRDHLQQFEVEYVESMAAIGRIPGSSNRREMVGEREMATRQCLARALKPLFPQGFTHTCKVTATLLASDGELDPVTIAINAVSAALAASSIPWHGPVGAVRLCSSNGNLIFSPTTAQLAEADFTLLYAGTSNDAYVLQLEGTGISEDALMAAIQAAAKVAGQAVEAQKVLVRQAETSKVSIPMRALPDPAALTRIASISLSRIEDILRDDALDCLQRGNLLDAAKAEAMEAMRSAGAVRSERLRTPGSSLVASSDLDYAWPILQRHALEKMVLGQNLRPGGRGLADLRPVSFQVDVLGGGVHGSGLFMQGEAQCLVTATVGRDLEDRRTEGVLGKGSDRVVVHYNSPIAIASQGRTERVEALQEGRAQSWFLQQALTPLLPESSELPFVLRIVANTLGLAGPTAMHALNAAVLAASSANFPLARTIAGVTIGCFSSSTEPGQPAADDRKGSWQAGIPQARRRELVTDVGLEEAELGDWILQVCGHDQGISALQLDCHRSGLPLDHIESALDRAKRARAQLLTSMRQSLQQRDSADGPRFGKVAIPKDAIGRLIGPGGSSINALQDRFQARVVVSDMGTVHFYAPNPQQAAAVKSSIEVLTGTGLQEGAVYACTVQSIRDFGAIVKLDSGQEMLLHISELADHRVRSVEDEVRVGQRLAVRCKGKDQRGMMRLSRRGLMNAL
ncbi:hypothetical protein WJX74_009220 [Apatococcus lobatus]|uniref:polyribonucleotide nucleotidyltransferase n=1 Tax=Apatococcus lobatus TaxID=904363 RepID=A0AAW1S3I6_9CHLO